jgi:hypothetical protein
LTDGDRKQFFNPKQSQFSELSGAERAQFYKYQNDVERKKALAKKEEFDFQVRMKRVKDETEAHKRQFFKDLVF